MAKMLGMLLLHSFMLRSLSSIKFGHFIQGVVLFSVIMTCTSLPYLTSYVTAFASGVTQLF